MGRTDPRRTEQRVSLYTLPGKPLFQRLDDPLTPHLRLVHQYPQCFRRLRIDRGAIRFVLSGVTLMVPGLTSPGGRLPNPDAAEEDAASYGGRTSPPGRWWWSRPKGRSTPVWWAS